MGLESHKKHDSSNILKAVDGHVPDKFEFSDDDVEISEDTDQYIAHPELKDKAHCVAIVINAQGFSQMKEDIKKKLRNLRTNLRAPRTYILLTHIDQACKEVNKDVTKVYQSTAIHDLVGKVSTMLDGLPENQIFPVMNYKEQVELKTAMDILLLYPLRQMLSNAQNYLEDELERLPGQDAPVGTTFRGNPVLPPEADA